MRFKGACGMSKFHGICGYDGNFSQQIVAAGQFPLMDRSLNTDVIRGLNPPVEKTQGVKSHYSNIIKDFIIKYKSNQCTNYKTDYNALHDASNFSKDDSDHGSVGLSASSGNSFARDSHHDSDDSAQQNQGMLHVLVEKSRFLRILGHQQSVIERRGSAPILTHVLLEAKGDTLSSTGTDLEMSLVEIIPAIVQNEGAITVPVHLLYDIVRKLPEGQVVLNTLPDGVIRVASGTIEFNVPTLSAEDFPQIHPKTLPFCLKIPASAFKQIIDDTRFSMSTEEARYSLNGIYFHPHGDQWRAVATDAHRLALSWLPFPATELENAPSVIVGRKTIQELCKLLGESNAPIDLFFSAQQMMVSFPGGHFSSRLLEGQFPDYWQAIPEGHPHQIQMDVKMFEQAISRVGMVSSERQRVIKMVFHNDTLTLSANSQQYGSAVETLSVDYSGEEFILGLNPKFLVDICQHIKGENVVMMFKDSLSPALFQDPQDAKVTYVLMPTRI
jgi:DNA polymerase-3 subunit beta